ncbi:MAG: NosD domain-containing protein [Candidatus Thorarchaeota archaeon]
MCRTRRWAAVSIIVSLLLPGTLALIERSRVPLAGSAASPLLEQTYLPSTDSGPIVIERNSDFAFYTQIGSGTETHPYIIQDLNFSSEGICVSVINTTAHFSIRNCVFRTNVSAWGEAAVVFQGVTNGRIENCTFEGGNYGVNIRQSNNCDIVENTFDTVVTCVSMYDSSRCLIAGNGQSTTIRYPMHIEGSSEIIIRNNQFSTVGAEGIRVSNSVDCRIDNNLIVGDNSDSYKLSAFSVVSSSDCVVSNNHATGLLFGVQVRNGEDNIVSNNTIVECAWGVRVAGNSCQVTDNRITAFYIGVDILFSNYSNVEHNDIQTVEGDSMGIDVIGGVGTQVVKNSIRESFAGIRVQGALEAIFQSNKIAECAEGLVLDESSFLHVSEGPPVDCQFKNNTLIGCSLQFNLHSPIGFSHIFEGNTVNGERVGYFFNRTSEVVSGIGCGQVILAVCTNTTVVAPVFHDQSTAIAIMFCTDVRIERASITDSRVGIHVQYSDRVVLDSAIIERCEMAVHIEDSDECHLYKCRLEDSYYALLAEESETCTVYECEIGNSHLAAVLVGAHHSRVDGNYIHDNEYGLQLLRTEGTFIVGNRVLNNTMVGILLNQASRDNKIFSNSIGFNGVNAICIGISNSFDDGAKRGNTWSDFGGEGVYEIDSDDVDRFPKAITQVESESAEEDASHKEYSLLDDPLFTLLMGVVCCGIVLAVFGRVR